MSALRFCANISWLFTELPDFPQRMRAAAAAGFRAVEAAWLYDADPQELRRAKEDTGLEVVLINTPPGDVTAGELGLAAVPGREEDFQRGLQQAIEYARILDCKRIHLMAGRVPSNGAALGEMESVFVRNLGHAAELLAKEGMTGLIEPINTRLTDPRYFLSSPHHAADILKKVAKENIKLQMDVFHWQIMDGNLTQNMQRYLPLLGHVQVAQVPDRNEPDSDGEVNYRYVFSTLERLGYRGYVGCEYKPRGNTREGLGWLEDYWTPSSK
ncbi:putative hydroxypyruvate isomerase [Corythoichthys intestinalis]|uniref:putative hydroxypyruvate isomerase n=1 Tax=Corythoichthys intestinalis TaxID=161448 RepID=UPI0025A566D4|nr:putative hydroxypyruvate isomerase [Corythoichthys intestinalis]XP_061790759.1 putative hydroxypyruvate isomerase [Nerophis lumbriciformis]